ncbi:helix-turn-helix domain-containing protein [Rhabdothermincola sediminis]|uniref:helix-turn-helix domain-containing protein n=1 Tax=Rhabdothermincola sediminis TaxID=2751370 RepID=UPI001AA069E4
MHKSARTDAEIAAEFGVRVRELRHERGLSQERLAHEADLHWSFVSQVERGKFGNRLPNLLRLAAALGVDPGALVSGIEPPDRRGHGRNL